MTERSKRPAADVAIVGTGMGGAAFAWQLSRLAPGLKIVALERGDWLKPADMPALTAEWQSAAIGRFSPSPNIRLKAGGNPWSADYAIDDEASPLKPLMWNGVGGSSINWAAHFPRMKPADFCAFSIDGVGDDWPFGYAELEPFYDLNDRMMGVCGLAGDPAYPPKPARLMPPLPLGRAGERAARAFNDLGWHWWPVDAAINTTASAGRGACNHCGPCLTGCVPQAKASTDVTYLPQAIRNGVELRTRAIVTRIIVDSGRARGVVYRDESGQTVEQPANQVVVAANGVGTTRLLLASGLGRAPESFLGRCLMMHPVAYARGVFEETLDGPAGPVGAALYSHEFYETNPARAFKRGFQIQITRENALLLQALRLLPSWGPDAQSALAGEFRHSITFMIVTEDLPERQNRVLLLDGDEPDGLPRVRMEYTVSAEVRAMIDYGYGCADRFFEAAGALQVIRQPLPPYTGWHLLGTARMGEDAATAVVDAKGRCHEVLNLIVADGSVMPTAGAVNPGSTIGALALKFAADLAEDLHG